MKFKSIILSIVLSFLLISCSSYVKPVVEATSITLSANKNQLVVNETLLLEINVEPLNANIDNITFSSSDISVAAVNNSGLVTALGKGEATISAKVKNIIGEYQITVLDLNDVVESLSIVSSKTTFFEKEIYQLSYDITPKTANINSMVYSSDDENIAKVNKTGLLTCIKEGKTNINLTINGYKTSLEINVIEKSGAIDIKDCNSTSQIDRYKNIGYSPLFKDNNYKKGLTISKSSTTASGGPLYEKPLRLYDGYNTKPDWEMAQWSTKYDIYNEKQGGYTLTKDETGLVNTITSGGKTKNDKFIPAKVITLNSLTGSCYLEANTEVEYNQPRKADEGWVHLLLSQSYYGDLTYVKNCSSIIMETTYTISKFEDHMGGLTDPNKHAAQAVWYITIQNRNQNSPSYGSYIWFGLCLWDNRHSGRTTDLYAAHDAGTSTIIYSPGSKDYLSTNNNKIPNVGQKVTAKIDIMGIVKDVYDLSIERGYFGETKFEDLAIGGFNFGFEVPGTYNIGMEVESIGVFAKKKL